MSRVDWKRRFVANTVLTYGFTAAKLLTGLILFPRYYTHFDKVEFGFWAVIWSFLGYTLVMDFGLGVTVKRAVARGSATLDLGPVSGLFATTFWIFCGFSVVLVGLAWALHAPLFNLLRVPESYRPEFAKAFLVFTIGVALMLPLSLFKAALMGLQRLDLVYGAMLLTTIASFLLLLYGLEHGWSLTGLMAAGVFVPLFDSVLLIVPAYLFSKGISVNPARAAWKSIRNEMGFSLHAYGISLLNVLLGQADRLIISRMLGLEALAIYQPGWKLGALVATGGGQILRAVPSAAAHLHAAKATEALTDLLLRASRLSFILGTLIYMPCAVYMQALLEVLTGGAGVPGGAWLTAQIFLLATWAMLALGAAARSIFLMTGEERFLFRYNCLALVVRLILGIGLAVAFGVPGVALGILISTVSLNSLIIVPRSLRHAGISAGAYFRHQFQGTVPGFLACGASLAVLMIFFPLSGPGTVWGLMWRGGAALVLPLLLLHRQIRSTWKAEDEMFTAESCVQE